MCGIAGVFRFRDDSFDATVVSDMLQHLERRGPDDRGLVSDGSATLGNRRLAILDLSPAGRQPMQSHSARYVITFNGEIYNYRELRNELGLDEKALRSSSDTEVLLHAWERWGRGCLERMVGQWAFAVYDRSERTLHLVRDRFGEKPLFYYEAADSIVFASTLRALMEAPWVPRELDPDAVSEYVTLRYVVSPRTVIRHVKKLPAGHLISAGRDGTRIERWYAPRFHASDLASRRAKEGLIEEFDVLFARACKRCLVSDVPVALLLSDGIDSNSIRASLLAQGEQVPAFTYSATPANSGLTAGAGSSDSAPVTDLVVSAADRLGDMIPAFRSLSEPVGDGAALATWMLIRNARPNATVFLCGHGGDELLGGYRLSQDRFRLSVVWGLAHLPLAWVRAAIERFVHGAESLADRRRRLIDAPRRMAPAAARYLIHRPLPVEDVATLFAGPTPGRRYLAALDDLYADCSPEDADLDRMQEVMLRTFLSENIVTFADSTAMDSSAELRMPFLDRDLAAFVLSLPPAMRVGRWPGRTNTKLILRWWARGRVADEIIHRRKRAFPFGNLPELLQSHGKELRDRIVGASAVRRVLPGVEEWLAQEPEVYRGPWEGTLWALLALGIWCEEAGVK